MRWQLLFLVATVLVAQENSEGPYARIAILRPHEGSTVDFEAGYIRHLEWHRQAQDPWKWFGWTVWAGERQRWFVYATFGHSAASFDRPVSAAEDEKDNVSNVVPHAEFAGNAVYEFLPRLSKGSGEPSVAARLELVTVDLNSAGSRAAFEAAVEAQQSSLRSETLWYRMSAGGPSPRYVRLRPASGVAAIIRDEAQLPEKAWPLIAKQMVEILNFRPTMSYGIQAAQ